MVEDGAMLYSRHRPTHQQVFMRQIVLDTETTGLNPRTGDRIIEIGCVEIVNRMLTGNNYHRYVNPERDSDEGALAVHGLTTEFLRDKPKFHEIVEELREYVRDAEVIIHNAPFDLGFLNHEFTRAGLPEFVGHCGNVIDTLVHAKELHPGKRNSLDALCDRYGISNAHRKLHGALLDAELLADVYLAMTRGQNSLSMDVEVESTGAGELLEMVPLGEIIVLKASDDEVAHHERVLAGLDKAAKGSSVWRAYAPLPPAGQAQ
jgi:DNA polymerase-3 subunit epsilon